MESIIAARSARSGLMRLVQIIHSLRKAMTNGKCTRVSELIDEFGSRAFGPFLILPAIIELSPLGAVPGVPTALAVFIALVSLQLLIGREKLWLPQFVAQYELDNDKVLPALEKAEPVLQRIDRWFNGNHLASLTRRPFTPFAALFCIMLAISVPPLELIPFASSAPMLTVAIVGCALLLRDGRLMLIAALFSALSISATGVAVSQLNAL